MPLTKTDLDDIRAVLQPSFNAMDGRFTTLEQQLREVERSLKSDIGLLQKAVLEAIETDRHLRNLVQELHERGIEVDIKKVFAS